MKGTYSLGILLVGCLAGVTGCSDDDSGTNGNLNNTNLNDNNTNQPDCGDGVVNGIFRSRTIATGTRNVS
jgi:hypothetical protein